jgi:hypothetical protein
MKTSADVKGSLEGPCRVPFPWRQRIPFGEPGMKFRNGLHLVASDRSGSGLTHPLDCDI